MRVGSRRHSLAERETEVDGDSQNSVTVGDIDGAIIKKKERKSWGDVKLFRAAPLYINPNSSRMNPLTPSPSDGAIRPRSADPNGWTAQPFQLNPFDQLIGIDVFGVHLEGKAVRQLAPLLDRVAERLDKPPVARPFPRRYSVDVARKAGLWSPSGLLRRGFVVHKYQSCHECCN
jgi:hypothetical protein